MSLSQITGRLQTTELLVRNQETRISNLESVKPTISSVLKSNTNANQQSITNLNSITTNNLTVQNNIQSLNNGQILGFSNIDSYKINSGLIRSNATATILTLPISNNTVGVIKGSVITGNSNFDFEIYCKNISNTVSLSGTTFSGFTNNDSLTFSHSTNNIIIQFHNSLSSNQKYTIKYTNNLIGI